MSLSRYLPNTREPVEDTKRRAWREHGMLVVNVESDQLSWDQREILRQVGMKLFGPRQQKTGGRA
jgi:hypothetical protein